MKTNKRGVSLIVLVITIIILAILAATVIIAIVNTGIINSAKDAVEAQKLGQVRDIATAAWGEALINPSVTTPEEYLNHIINILKGEGYTDTELDKYIIVANVNGVTVNLKNTDVDNPDVTPDEPEVNPDTPEVAPDVPEVNPDTPGDTEYAGLTITKDTEGVTFTKADGVTPGDPDNIENGDIVIYGDYEYRYNSEWDASSWYTNDINGWGVKLRDECFEQTSVGELCGSIYDKPLALMQCTYVTEILEEDEFGDSYFQAVGANITISPRIPSTVIDMSYTFEICGSLTEAPVIPSGVTSMDGTFYGCSSLTEAPVIPSGVTSMYNTFGSYTSLTGVVQINSALVSDMEYCFSGITNPLTVKVAANSTTYETIMAEYGDSSNITIQTFTPQQ